MSYYYVNSSPLFEMAPLHFYLIPFHWVVSKYFLTKFSWYMRKLMIFEIVLCNWTVYLTQFKCILGILGRQEHLQIIIGASFSPLFDFGLYILDNSIRQEKKKWVHWPIFVLFSISLCCLSWFTIKFPAVGAAGFFIKLMQSFCSLVLKNSKQTRNKSRKLPSALVWYVHTYSFSSLFYLCDVFEDVLTSSTS